MKISTGDQLASLNNLRHVHTNPLKCALHQITSNRFEPIRICSIDTLKVNSNTDYENYIV